MTFLNAALLAGLAAAALPILIHLFSRRRYPIIDFSTLRFLKKLQRQQMRRLKVRQWLLLLLRTLAVLVITLAFARPAMLKRMELGGLASSRIGMAIVLDVSASMQAKSQQSTVFGKAKTAIEALIAQMNPDDRATIVVARNGGELLTSSPTGDKDDLLRLLGDVQPWDGGGDVSGAVTTAVKALGEARGFRAELYVVSDFSPAVELSDPPPDVIPYFVRIRPDSPANLAVKTVAIVSEIIEPDRPVTLEISFQNYGHMEQKDVYYSIFLNGVRVGEDVITIAADSEAKHRHEVQPEKAGLQEGMVQIEERDVFPLDNRGYYCFRVPESLKVLLVGDEAYCRAIRLALAARTEQYSLINLTQTGRDTWDLQAITDYDVIIFSDPSFFSGEQVTRLQHFIENGGGLFLLPGSNTDVGAINRDLFDKVGAPKWGEKVGKPGSREHFLEWRPINVEASIIRGIFRSGSQPTTPHFYQALRLIGPSDNIDLSFSNGAPFLTDTPYGTGRVLLCASSPHTEWSDWAERGIFAPLMHRLVLWLAGGSQEGCHFRQAGDFLDFPAGRDASSQATLLFPDGHKEEKLPQVTGQKVVFMEPQLGRVGIYRLETGQSHQIAATNVPPIESDLRETDLQETCPAWRQAGVTICGPDQLAETVRKSRYGRELWRIALIIVMGILILESAIGFTGKKGFEVEPKESKAQEG